MSAISSAPMRGLQPTRPILHLENGERTDQKTFHAWYVFPGLWLDRRYCDWMERAC